MITTGTRVLLTISDSGADSIIPLIHGAAFKNSGINAVVATEKIPESKMGATLDVMRVLDFWGGSCTTNLKETAISHLDELDETARHAGAVTTIVNRDGCLRGYNTDIYSISKILEQDLGMDPKGQTAVLLGTGAVCRAAIIALCNAEVKMIYIVDRIAERAAKLVDEFSRYYPNSQFECLPFVSSKIAAVLGKTDLMINTIDSRAKEECISDLPWTSLKQNASVLDVSSSTEDTPFLSEARAHNYKAIGAVGMLLSQAEKDFELWTGTLPARGSMRFCFDEVSRR